MSGRTWTVLAVVVAALSGGCTVGSGSGQASGDIFEYGCIHDPVNLSAPRAYNLQPSYFAGEPIEDLSVNGTHMNELRIRMQNSGLSIQYTDTLYFDIINSYEVARCVRGRIDNNSGQPDWKLTEPLPDGTQTVWCDWSGTAFADGGAARGVDAGSALDGGMSVMASAPRIHITPYTDVRSSFATLSTCGINNITGIGFDGWIQFQYFGGAGETDRPPDERDPVDTNFVIQFGDRMRATFDVLLEDQILVTSKQQNLPPSRDAQIYGNLSGYFDFNLERGRSAQPFP